MNAYIKFTFLIISLVHIDLVFLIYIAYSISVFPYVVPFHWTLVKAMKGAVWNCLLIPH